MFTISWLENLIIIVIQSLTFFLVSLLKTSFVLKIYFLYKVPLKKKTYYCFIFTPKTDNHSIIQEFRFTCVCIMCKVCCCFYLCFFFLSTSCCKLLLNIALKLSSDHERGTRHQDLRLNASHFSPVIHNKLGLKALPQQVRVKRCAKKDEPLTSQCINSD